MEQSSLQKKGKFSKKLSRSWNAIWLTDGKCRENNCNDDIHFVAINIPVAHLPPYGYIFNRNLNLNEGGLDAALRTGS